MTRLAWVVLLISILIPSTSFANSVTNMDLEPNDGSGGNFGFRQRVNGSTIDIVCGTPLGYFDDVFGYKPGTKVLGGTEVFFDFGRLTVHGQVHDLDPAGLGDLFVSSLTLPTNGKSTFTALVTADFSITVTDVVTNQTFGVHGSGKGRVTFQLEDNGLYYPRGVTFTNTPEPGTFGLIGTGLIASLGAARRRLSM